jgi:hypothetical protein
MHKACIAARRLYATFRDGSSTLAQALFIKAITVIENLNWHSILRCSMMDLSPLFSSKDRFSPLLVAGFFLVRPFVDLSSTPGREAGAPGMVLVYDASHFSFR